MKSARKTSKEKGQHRDKAVLWIIRGLLHLQSRWADWMEQRTQNISPRTWAVLLAGFVMVSVSFNAWLIWKSLSEKEHAEVSVTPLEKTGYTTRESTQDSLVKDSLMKKKNANR